MERVVIVGLGPSGCAVLSRLRQEVVGPPVTGRHGVVLLGVDFAPQRALPARQFVRLTRELPETTEGTDGDWRPYVPLGTEEMNASHALYSARQVEASLTARIANIHSSIAPRSGGLVKYYVVTSAADPAGAGLVLYFSNLIRRAVYAMASEHTTPPVTIAGVIMLPPGAMGRDAAQAYAAVKEIALAEHIGWLPPRGGPGPSRAESARHVFDYACYLVEPAHEERAEYAPRTEAQLSFQVAEWLALVTYPAVSDELRRCEADRPPHVAGPSPYFVALGLGLCVVPRGRIVEKCALRLSGEITGQLLKEVPSTAGFEQARSYLVDNKLGLIEARLQMMRTKDGVVLRREFGEEEALRLDLPIPPVPWRRLYRQRPGASPGRCVERWKRFQEEWEKHRFGALDHALATNAGHLLHDLSEALGRAVRVVLGGDANGAVSRASDMGRCLLEGVDTLRREIGEGLAAIERTCGEWLGYVRRWSAPADRWERLLAIGNERLANLVWMFMGLPVALLAPAVIALVVPGMPWSTQLKMSAGLCLAVLVALAWRTRLKERDATWDEERRTLRRRFALLVGLGLTLPSLIWGISETPTYLLWLGLLAALLPLLRGVGSLEAIVKLGETLGFWGSLSDLAWSATSISDLGQALMGHLSQMMTQKGASPFVLAALAAILLLFRIIATEAARRRIMRHLTRYRVALLRYLDAVQSIYRDRHILQLLEAFMGEIKSYGNRLMTATEDIKGMETEFRTARSLPSLNSDAGGDYLDFPTEISLSGEDEEEHIYGLGSQSEYPDGLAALTSRLFSSTPFDEWLLDRSPGDRRATILDFSRLQFVDRGSLHAEDRLVERSLGFGRRPSGEAEAALEEHLDGELLPRLKPLCGNLPAGFPRVQLVGVCDVGRSPVARVLGEMRLERGLLTVFSSKWADGVFGLSFVHEFRPGIADTWGAYLEAYASYPDPLALHTRVQFAEESDGWMGCDVKRAMEAGRAARKAEARGDRQVRSGRPPAGGPPWSSRSWDSVAEGGEGLEAPVLDPAAAPVPRARLGTSGGRAAVRDAHGVLGLDPGASDADVTRAFDVLVRQHHASGPEGAGASLADINRAYDLLSRTVESGGSDDPEEGVKRDA